MSTVNAAGLTHVGLVRDHNEDAFCVDSTQRVFLVADGMGGHAAGEVASKMAIDLVSESWASNDVQRLAKVYASHNDVVHRQELLHALCEAVLQANQAIATMGNDDQEKRGMGTTLTGFLLAGGEAVFAHVGDSRAYLIRDRIPVLLSEDHTVSARLRVAGIDRGIDEPEPEYYKGMLVNALGNESTRITSFVLPVYNGDQLVLCSDGVHDYLSEVEFGDIVGSASDCEHAVQALIDTALERGGADNATAIVVEVVEAGKRVVPAELRAKHEAALGSCSLFRGLTSQQVLRALRISTPRFYEAGGEIPRVALEDRVAYIVLDGEMAGSGVSGRAGDVVLVEALLQETVLSEASIRATSDLHLLMIRRNDFIELCEDDPDLGVLLYENVAAIVAR